jgi:hypothetical protein
MRYQINDLLEPDIFAWATREYAKGRGFWRSWLRWQKLRAWHRKEKAADINSFSGPVPNESDDWPLLTGGLPLEPDISRSHWLRCRPTGEVKKLYWCSEDGSWYGASASDWKNTGSDQLNVRQVHYGYIYIEPVR